jgi:DNA-binding SARP family transcriptional activator/WD40 repeat protein
MALRPGQVVNADRLADALWGEQPPASWPKVVQGCVVRLRRTLGAGSIETVAGGYRLVLAGDDLDTTQFERLVARGRGQAATGEPEQAAAAFARALVLWRGNPFQDLDKWATGRSEAGRLEELRRTTEEDLLAARLAAGEHREVVAEAEARVAEEPLREQRWAILALAQWRCARQADALRSLHRARQTLAEELGVDPGPELVALEEAILRQDPSLSGAQEALPAASACPYKGLAPYEAADADSFFGRDDEVSACLHRLATSSLLVVAGPSGCGKSSLVRAGVLPALVRARRSVVVLVPGADPDAALTSALAGHEGTPVVVVDQLEELFTLNLPDAARAFCGRLAAYANDVASVIVAVRADHLASLGAEPRFTDMAERGLHLVRPLEGDALRSAIDGPAAQAGLRLEHGLVDLLIRDSEGEPGALPLLSHALAETWANRDGRVLTVDGYRATGGIRAAVARSADRLYDSLPSDQRTVLRSVMLRMVSASPDGEPVRSRIPARTLGADPTRERVLGLLVRARLVTTEADTVELAHEALARAWPRLRSWLDEDAEGQKIFRHLAAAADGWDSLDREPSELYRGARLQQALEWEAATHPDLTQVERDFLDASRAAAAADRAALTRQNRRLRRLLVGVGVLLVAALITGAVAVWQRQRADRNGREAAAQSREASAQGRLASLRALVSDSLALRTSNRDVAALLAVEAHRLDPGVPSEKALFSTFTGAPGLERIGHLGGKGAEPSAFLSDNKTVAFEEGDGAIRLVDTTRGTETAKFAALAPSHGFVLSAASSDGRAVAVTWRPVFPDLKEASLAVWDVRTHKRRFFVKGLDLTPGSLAMNADGSLVAIAGGDEGRTQILDGTNGRLRREVVALPRPADAHFFVNTVAVAFDGHGRLIVTSQAGPIRWIDPATGNEVKRINGQRETNEGFLWPSPDGRTLITYGWQGIMRYDVASGRAEWPSPVKDLYCNKLAWAVRLNSLLCTKKDAGQIVALDPATGVNTGSRFDVGAGAGSGLVSPNGTTLVAAAGAGTAYSVWRLDSGGPVTTVLSVGDGQWLSGYAPDGDLLVGHEGRALRLVDPVSGKVHGELDGVESLVPAVPGPRWAALYLDDTIGWYDLAYRRPAGPKGQLRLPPESTTPTRIQSDWDVFQGIVVVDHRAIAWTELNDPRALRWMLDEVDLDTGKTTGPTFDENDEQPRWLFATDPDHVFTMDALQDIHQFDARTGLEQKDLGGPYWHVTGNGRVVLATSVGGDIVQVDSVDLRPLGDSFPGSQGTFAGMALARGGQRVVQINNVGVRLYDVATRTQLGEALPTPEGVATAIIGQRDTGVVLRADGHAAAAVSDHGVVSWDLDPEHWEAKACEVAGRNLTRAEWDKHIGGLAPYHAICPQFPVSA